MKHWKSISATLLAASLVTSTSGQAWADETEKVDSSDFEIVDLQEALENVKDETVTSEDLEVISSIVPVGYMANNITALSLNLEKISNPRAKEALQKNIDRAIARWEAKNKVEEEVIETPEEEVVVTPEEEVVVTPEEEVIETPEEEVVVTPEEEGTTEEEPVAVVSEEDEDEDEEKTEAEIAAKKAEIAAKKEAKKAEIAAKKEAKKVAKEERKANREEKHENKGKKDKE